MLNINFNRTPQSNNENESSQEKTNNDFWESKYDVSLPILKDDYFYSLKLLNDTDEKANRYLIVISIALTGFFVVTSGSSIDYLNFDCGKGIFFLVLSILFIIFFIGTVFYGFIVFRAALKCFNLVSIERIPDIRNSLDITSDQDILQYKDYLINAYQLSINSLESTINVKQSYLHKISVNTNYFILCIFLSILMLMTLKILG